MNANLGCPGHAVWIAVGVPDLLQKEIAMARRRTVLAGWSQALPTPLNIPDVVTLTTLADVRVFVGQHLPEPYRDGPHWLAVARHLEAAVRGGDAQKPPWQSGSRC